MLFIQISRLLLDLWHFPSRFPSCLLSGVLQPLLLTGKELCPCWCGSLLQPGVGYEPKSMSTLLSIALASCFPQFLSCATLFPIHFTMFSPCRWKMLFLQRWHPLSWSCPVLFCRQQVNKTKQQLVGSPVGSPCLELCCHGLGSSFPIPGVFYPQ